MKVERFLTEEEDAEFDLYINLWAERLGLDDWDFYRGLGKPKNVMADMVPHYKARYGKYRTGNWTHIAPTSDALEKIACHEVLHVFLAELLVAFNESEDADWQMSAEHRVINVLTKLLTKDPQ